MWHITEEQSGNNSTNLTFSTKRIGISMSIQLDIMTGCDVLSIVLKASTDTLIRGGDWMNPPSMGFLELVYKTIKLNNLLLYRRFVDRM